MESMNRSFVGDPIARGKIAEVLTDMAENPGPQLFHCTSGKDRTGWISALLLSIAGVPRETIVQDYLLTNEYSTVSIQALIDRFTAAKGPAFAPIITKVAGVERNYLEAGLSELDLEYGSVDRYLVEGLGLSPATILTLKAKLLF